MKLIGPTCHHCGGTGSHARGAFCTVCMGLGVLVFSFKGLK